MRSPQFDPDYAYFYTDYAANGVFILRRSGVWTVDFTRVYDLYVQSSVFNTFPGPEIATPPLFLKYTDGPWHAINPSEVEDFVGLLLEDRITMSQAVFDKIVNAPCSPAQTLERGLYG